MLTFSWDQSSFLPLGLDAQLDYTAVNSQFMSTLNKAPNRLEAGLRDFQAGSVFHKLSDELGNLMNLIDVSPGAVQTHDTKTYLGQQNNTAGSPNMATPGLASLYFPTDGGVTSIGPSETYSIDQTMRTKIPGVESRNVVVMSKGRKERSKDSNGSGCEIEAKRDALRQRNRIAANKCRQQKRARINELQVKERDLISRKHYLNTVVEILRNELIVLKFKCLEHADRGCEGIREFLDDSVVGPSQTALSVSLYQNLGEDIKHE